MTDSMINLTPDPRILQILGEINLDQWKCLAELIDNSVDAFINAKRANTPVSFPEISISLPQTDKDDAAVTIRDNGPGMSLDQLEQAVRAGWTGNNPLTNLGLFGMGFNIATARLGLVTEVYTTRAGDSEWTGLRIDLEELRNSRSFFTPRLSRPKADSSVSGTEIRILRLKADQRQYFAKSANHQRIRKQLSRVYSPLLLSTESPFKLQVNGQWILGRKHCYWDPDRTAPIAGGSLVHAVEIFDFTLASRHYCLTCMTSFTGGTCPTAAASCKTIELKRRLRGWVGIQRYLDEEDFGIDLIRNGRVIEVQNKDLFVWTGGDRHEREYPIDDQRYRGRFIGEIHLDHCRVSYTKDRFERDDPSWPEMVHLVRGDGPLQPRKAKALGFETNQSPLWKIFQAFRRSDPQVKNSRWARILAVKNNDRAVEMAESFYKGDPDYQSDEKWYALVEEQDKALVGDVGGDPGISDPPLVPEGFLDDPPQGPDGGKPVDDETIPLPEAPKPSREKSHELSRTYRHPLLKIEFPIEAFAVEANDEELIPKLPWRLRMDDAATRSRSFFYNPRHSVFRSMTFTPRDALLSELAVLTFDFLRETNPAAGVFSAVLSDFRKEYDADGSMEPKKLSQLAEGVFRELSGATEGLPLSKLQELFNALPAATQIAIRKNASNKGVVSLGELIADGEFMRYTSPGEVIDFVRANPELFFDGKYWEQPYGKIELGSPEADSFARDAVLSRYLAYLSDAEWLSNYSPRDVERANRDELVRAVLSVRLLQRDSEP